MKKTHYHIILNEQRNKAFFIKRKNINKNKFFKYFGIKKNTFMAKILNDLFFDLFDNSINLYKEYKIFYKREFFSFEEYLQQKHNLLPNEVKLFQNKKSYYKEINIYNINNILDSADYIVQVLEKHMGKFYRHK